MSDLLGGLGGLLGGIFGGVSANQNASAANANAGHVNLTTQQNPWGPAQDYYQGLMSDVYGAIQGDSARYGGTTPVGAGQQAPFQPITGAGSAQAGGSSGLTQVAQGVFRQADGTLVDANGNTLFYGGGPAGPGHQPFAGYSGSGAIKESTAAPYPNTGAGAAPAAGGAPPAAGAGATGLTGESASTSQAIQALLAAAAKGSSVYDPSSQMIQQLEKGQSTNPMQAQTFADLASNYANGNPALAQMIQQLFAGQTPGSPGSGGAGGSAAQQAAAAALAQFGGGGGGGTQVTIQGGGGIPEVAQYIKDQLASKYDPNSDPNLAAEMQAANRQTETQFKNSVLPGINSDSMGSGLMGGSAWREAMGQAANNYATALAGSNANLQGQNYQEYLQQKNAALQAGEGINVGAGNNAAQIAAAMASAGGTLGAARTNASANYALGMASLAQQDQLARMGELGTAIGTQQQGQLADLSGMGQQSTAFGAEQLGALNAAPAISNIPYAGYEAAGNLSAGADRNAVAAQQAADQLRASLAGVSLGKSQLGFQEQQFYDPMTRLAQASGIIGNLTHGFGSTTQTGTDFRNMPQQNVGGQTMAGILGGSQLGSGLGNMLGGLGGGPGGGGGGSPVTSTPGLTTTALGNGLYQGSDGQIYDSSGNVVDPNYGGDPNAYG